MIGLPYLASPIWEIRIHGRCFDEVARSVDQEQTRPVARDLPARMSLQLKSAPNSCTAYASR
jgi:hypothetical protein